MNFTMMHGSTSIKFLGNLSNGSRADIFGQMDRREGTSRRFIANVPKRLKFKTQQSGKESVHVKQKTE